jgi:hypothetical protein
MPRGAPTQDTYPEMCLLKMRWQDFYDGRGDVKDDVALIKWVGRLLFEFGLACDESPQFPEDDPPTPTAVRCTLATVK